MTTVRIYQPSKTAMQSGKGNTKQWHMTFESQDPLKADPLMGWTSSHDMSQELCLIFPTLSKAIDFAKVKGFSYTIYNPSTIKTVPKSYSLNFTCPRVRGS